VVDDFERKFEAVDSLSRDIAVLEHENWFVLEQAQKVQDQIAKVRAKHEKAFGGSIGPESLIRRKVEEFRRGLELRSRSMPKSRIRPTLRITGPMKIHLLKAMLLDFESTGTEAITLEEIESWCSRDGRKGRSEVLNEMGIGSISVPSTQFFQTTINGNSVQLYPANAYRTQKPPSPARFHVKEWLRWLKKEESRLLRGEQTSSDKASARKRTKPSK
jgi:hypothetical protein